MEKDRYPKVYLYRQVVQAKLFIDSHYHRAMAAGDIAREACFSKFHFIRLFKTIYGQTPHQYLTSVRIARAKTLLQSPMPVHQVCFAVGFDSLPSFTGLFKRRTTLTPSLYQRQQLQRKNELDATPLKFIPHCFAEHKGWTEKSNFQEV